MCRDLGYLQVDFGHEIVKEGEVGDTFYMIMTGTVEVSSKAVGSSLCSYMLSAKMV